ncbi:hypothetical protein BJF78_33115 [Pseudonocardia sp. CNS-139]|nr:hypothetical protein BJF78_33115 [Pseudonocardia sp. CNS-139]
MRPDLQTSVRRVYTLLRAGIRSGTLAPDAQLVESEVAALMDASRNSVRRALQMLAAEGLVSREPRQGTSIVRGIVRVSLDQRTVPDQSSALWRGGNGPLYRSELLECREVTPSEYVRTRLALRSATVTMSEHLVYLLNEPVSVCLVYTPVGLAAENLQLENRNRACAFRHRFGVELGRHEDTVEAVACEARTGTLLGVRAGSPILLRETLAVGADGVPRELTYKYNRGDRVAVVTVTEGP